MNDFDGQVLIRLDKTGNAEIVLFKKRDIMKNKYFYSKFNTFVNNYLT